MKSNALTFFGVSMIGTSFGFQSCAHQAPLPEPLPEQTASDVALGLELAAQVSDLVAAAVQDRTTREGCIVSRVAGPALRSAAAGVRAGATAAPVLPALDLDLTSCGDAELFPIAEDAAPWLAIWSSVVGTVRIQIDRGVEEQTCVARAVSSAVLGWVVDDLTNEIAQELIELTADGRVMIDEQPINLALCGA